MSDSSQKESGSELVIMLRRLTERVDRLCQQNEQLQMKVDEMSRQLDELRTLSQSVTSPVIPDAAELSLETALQETPLPFDYQPTNCSFHTHISEYEAGMLFEQPAFDLTLRFNHNYGNRIARQWGFEDTGHLLLAILECCLERIPAENEELVFRSDLDSATVYARERKLLEAAQRSVLRAGASATGTFELIQQLSPESRRRE